MRRKSADDLIKEFNINVDELYNTFIHNSASATVKKFGLKGQKQIIRILEEKGYDLSVRLATNIVDEHWIWQNSIDMDKMYECYLHNGTEYVSRQFNIPSRIVKKLLIDKGYDLSKRDPIESRRNRNGYSAEELVEKNNIDVQSLYDMFLNNGALYTAQKFGLSHGGLVERILAYYGYTWESRDIKKINYHKTAEKIKEKYNVEHALQIPESKEKLIQTNRKRFDSDYFMGTEEFISRSKKTNRERYGYEWSTQSPEVKLNHERANYLKYGVKDWKQAKASAELKKYLNNSTESIALLLDKELTFSDLKEMFPNDTDTQLYSWLSRFDLFKLLKRSTKSEPEKHLAEFLAAYGFTVRNDRTLLGNGQEIDIYNPQLKIGVEFNGLYYHSTQCILDKNYHFDKSKLAEKRGIYLVHIYEDEWSDLNRREKIKYFFKNITGNNSVKIYARNCIIKKISNLEAKKFNECYNLQNHRNAQVTYALFYNNIPVQLMSFKKIKCKYMNSCDSWEIISHCCKFDTTIVGGFSKLFKKFKAEYNPSYIVSYCDFNKFDGHSYSNIDMHFVDYTGPNKNWVLGSTLINSNSYHYHELKEKAKSILWGSGKKKYVWKIY